MLRKFMDGKLIYPDATFYWKEFGVKLRVAETKPTLKEGDLALYREDEVEKIDIKVEDDKPVLYRAEMKIAFEVER